MRWTRKTILKAIVQLHEQDTDLNYAAAEARHLNLVRAAIWHFGTWHGAVEAAGLDYAAICKYRHWDRDRIVARIRELHERGEDLSWREVSTRLDPPLAAAALRPNGFSSWREAIVAAGLDIEQIARYQRWNAESISQAIQQLHQSGAPLSSKAAQQENQSLFCAARRHFGSWDKALRASGLDAQTIRLRGRVRPEVAVPPLPAPELNSAPKRKQRAKA